jgi:hypothetical protein
MDMQQDLKRERPGAPPPVGKSLQAEQDKHVTRTLRTLLLACRLLLLLLLYKKNRHAGYMKCA